MKPKSTLRNFLVLATCSLLAVSYTQATTYTWTQDAFGTYDWTTGGNWSGSTQFVSGSTNELMFFADTTTVVNAGTGTITINNVQTPLSMNTLTLNGRGPNGGNFVNINIGDSNSTWTIGDGTTSTISYNSTQGGGHAGLDDIRYTIAANLILNQTTTTFTGNGYSLVGGYTFSGDISHSVSGNGITKSGTSTLVFSGNNTYNGTTLVSGGILRLNSANALSGGIGTTGGTSALTLNGGVLELGFGDFKRNLGTGSDQFQITGGTSGFSASGAPRKVTVNGDSSTELQWGSASFAPTTLVLNSGAANNSIELTNKIDLNAATRTVEVNADKALISGDIRTSSGTAGLTKTGSGALVLTGNNTYNGNTTLTAGALSVETAGNLGSGSSNLVLNGGTLQIRGTALTSMTGLGHTVSITNNVNVGFDIQNAANTFTVDQVLNNNSGNRTLTKSGVGTLVLNQNNSFTGATTVTDGGTLVLDYSTNNGSKLSDTAALTLNGSAIVLKGGNHTEVVGSTTLVANTSSSISRDGISPGSAKISLGAITMPTVSSLTISEANLATTTTANNASGILSLGRVTVGSDFGANDGSGNIVAYTGYTTYTPATATTGSNSVVNQLTGGGNLANSLLSYSLRIANSGSSDVLELGSKNLTLLNNGTFLYAGGGDNNYTINGTGSIGSASGNQPFTINTYTGTTLTVNAKVSGNIAPVLKAGEGTLVFGGNSAVGTTYVQQGVLRVTNNNGLGNTSNGTNVQGGAALELAKDISNNNISIGAEALSLNGAGISNGGALRNKSGDNSFAGAITIGASGARINADASSSLTLSGGIATTLTQDVTFGGAGNTTVSTAAISGSGRVIKDGAGTLTLSATNDYSGVTTVSAGTLYVTGTLSNSAVSVGANGAIGSSGGAGARTLGNGLTIAAGGDLDLTGATLGLGSTGILSLTGGSLTLGNLTFQDLVGWNWLAASAGTYELIDGTFSIDFGSTAYLSEGTAYDFGNGKKGYFTQGSLNAVIVAAVPEPSTALLGALGLLALLRRRR